VPRECFVRITTTGRPTDVAARARTGKARNWYKPLYVDFENAMSVSVLQRSIRLPGHEIIIEEAMPSSDDALFGRPDHRLVEELVVELVKRDDQ
jgi:hypothetical protein